MANIANYVTFQDANQVETTDGSYEPLKPGKYVCEVEDIELKETKSGGAGLNVKLSVVYPNSVGRKVFDWINLAHPTSQKCVEIGQQQLAGFCKGLGIPMLQDTDHALTKKIGVVVAIDKDDSTKNRVKGYYNPVTEQPQAPVSPTPVAPVAPTTTSMPWEQ